ncbi:hypothetical protein SNE510_35760 [Streptomyces sp. NE5-10]|uniref:hypothetical protein n=1 Tax=Streptomyces sp. NE5-10 TaxID=2759674 RepID=UPI001A369AFF|nr:hypothetical protein [Streptomyces sp. NE5-10]GHJ94057.1 hypothetical protein SNE510_35760 [Streptomyces sp. NE5-10]
MGTGAVRPARSVGIRGVGGLGAHAVRPARMVGAASVLAIDPLPSARERALLFGADVALVPLAPDFAEAVREATAGRGLYIAHPSRSGSVPSGPTRTPPTEGAGGDG